MAAALAPVAERFSEEAGEALKELKEDPWGTSSAWLIETGFVLAVLGGGGWLLGSYLTDAARQADADAGRRLAFVGATFDNAKAAGAAAGGAVSAAIQNLAPVTTGTITLVAPGKLLAYIPSGTVPMTVGMAVKVTDASGAVVKDSAGADLDGTKIDWLTVNPNVAWRFESTDSPVSNLHDGPIYTVEVGIHSEFGVVKAKYTTSFIGSYGIVVDPDFTAKTVTIGNGNTSTDVTEGAAGTTVPTETAVTASTTSNPLQAYGVIAGDLVGGIVGAAVGITDIPKAIWAGAQVFPYLLWDGFVGAFAGAFGWLGTNLGPPMMMLGLLLVGIGVVLRYSAERVFPRLELYANARGAEFWNRVDRKFGTRQAVQRVWTQKSTEGMIAGANAAPRYEFHVREPEPPKSGAQEATEKPPKGPVRPGTPAAPESPAGGPEPPDPDAPGHHSVRPGTGEVPQGPSGPPEGPGAGPGPANPLPGDRPIEPTPTEKVEEELGGHHAIEPTADEIREMEEARRESHPEPETLPPAAPPRMTEEEYWAGIDRIRLDSVRSASDAMDLAQEKTAEIDAARATRREAKVMEKVLGRKGWSKRAHRGALAGMAAENA